MKKETIIVIILVIALFGIYSLNRADLGRSIPDEKRYIQSTREMVESGDYITPRYHGKLRFQKPILFYWFIILSYKVFGIGIFGARLPSVIAAILNVIIVYLLGRELFNRKVGIFSACIISTSEIFFMYSGFAAPDMTFFLFITASIYFFMKIYLGDGKRNFKYLPIYVFMALAMLTKGPLGFFYPMGVISLFLILRKDWYTFRELKFPLGFLIFIAVSAPWFIIMIALHGNEYLGNVWSLEIMKKLKYFSSGSHDGLFSLYLNSTLYYIGMIFVRFLPWTVFTPAALISMRNRAGERSKKSDCGFHLIISWFSMVFISLVLIWARQSHYVIALSIPFSLFMGVYFSKLTGESNLSNSILFKLPFIAAILISFVAFVLWHGFAVYVLDKPIFSFSLLILIAPAFMIYAYGSKKNKIFLPLSFFFTAATCITYLFAYVIPTVDDKPLLHLSKKISEVIDERDIVGVASSEVGYHRLNVYIKEYKVSRVDKPSKKNYEEELKKGKRRLINEFLSREDTRVFCAMTRDDYYRYVDEDLRNRLYILDETFKWKRLEKQDIEYFKGILSHLLSGERELLRKDLREEIYLISNKR